MLVMVNYTIIKINNLIHQFEKPTVKKSKTSLIEN
jgi:hypothetical protein